MRRSILLPLVACAGLLGLAVPARGDVVSIAGSFDGDSTLTPTGTPGVYTQSFSGDGTDSTFGAFTVSSTSTIDFSHPPAITVTNGMLTEVFSDGTLLGTGSGDGTGNGSGMATFTIDFIVTGGTGLLLGAMGEVTVTGTITQTSPTTESIAATYTGAISVPEPGSLTLLGLGAAAGLAAWRRRGERKPALT
jgi:hypothetical protein